MRILKELFRSPALIGFFAVFGLWLFYGRRKGYGNGESANTRVNDAIITIDNSINRVGTIEDDIFDVFKGLTPKEIVLLYKDFGTRYYSSKTGRYSIIPFEISHFVIELNLRGLLERELTYSEHNKLKSIHKEKGLPYPYI